MQRTNVHKKNTPLVFEGAVTTTSAATTACATTFSFTVYLPHHYCHLEHHGFMAFVYMYVHVHTILDVHKVIAKQGER